MKRFSSSRNKLQTEKIFHMKNVNIKSVHNFFLFLCFRCFYYKRKDVRFVFLNYNTVVIYVSSDDYYRCLILTSSSATSLDFMFSKLLYITFYSTNNLLFREIFSVRFFVLQNCLLF